MTDSERFVRAAAIVPLSVPVFCLVACASFALRARIKLGYWATYNNPDPKTLDWPIHHSLIFVIALAIYPALITSAAFSLVIIRKRQFTLGSFTLVSAIGSHFLLKTISETPLGDEFVAWIID